MVGGLVVETAVRRRAETGDLDARRTVSKVSQRPLLPVEGFSGVPGAAQLKDLRSLLVCAHVSTLSLESRPATIP